MGSSRARIGLSRSTCLDKLGEHAIVRMEAAVPCASALADGPMQDLEEHLCGTADPQPPSKGRRAPLAGVPAGCVDVPACFVAPAGCGNPSADIPGLRETAPYDKAINVCAGLPGASAPCFRAARAHGTEIRQLGVLGCE